MKEALAKVRKALSRQDITPAFTQYLVRDGMLGAYDGRFGAAAPVDYEGTFLVPGREFERLIDRLPEELTSLTNENDSITLRAGRMHGTIRTLPPEDVRHTIPDNDWGQPPAAFLEALRLTRPFISDNAIHDWALCASLESGIIRATTNVSIVEITCPGLEAAGLLLPCWAIDYVLSRAEKLTGLQLFPNYAAFLWDDNSWMRTQLVNSEFPDAARRLFEEFVEPTWAILPEWRQAYETIVELAEGEIEIHADKLVGRQGAGVTEYAVPSTPVPEGGVAKFDPKFLTPVIKHAERWEPDAYPNPTSFAASGLRGFVVGRR